MCRLNGMNSIRLSIKQLRLSKKRVVTKHRYENKIKNEQDLIPIRVTHTNVRETMRLSKKRVVTKCRYEDKIKNEQDLISIRVTHTNVRARSDRHIHWHTHTYMHIKICAMCAHYVNVPQCRTTTAIYSLDTSLCTYICVYAMFSHDINIWVHTKMNALTHVHTVGFTQCNVIHTIGLFITFLKISNQNQVLRLCILNALINTNCQFLLLWNLYVYYSVTCTDWKFYL